MRQQKDALPLVALFEADNSQWKLDAMENIRIFVDGHLKELAKAREIDISGVNIVM